MTRSPAFCAATGALVVLFLGSGGILGGGCSSGSGPDDGGDAGVDADGAGDAGVDADGAGDADGGVMTFRVTLPANTPVSDVITMYTFFGVLDAERVDKVAEFSVPPEFFAADGGRLRYRYTRNGADFVAAEYLEPDSNDYFFSDLGREATFTPGGLQQDTVSRWRFFPAGDLIPPLVSIDPLVDFAEPRLGGSFAFGVFLQDLYMPWFDRLFVPCAQHLGSLGYQVVMVSPAWHVLNADPPELGTNSANPDYTDDALHAQIQALASAGIDVLVQPQIDPGFEAPAGQPATYWDAYFAALSAFLEHHAEIAQAAGASRFSFYPYGMHPNPPADADARFRSVIAKIQAVFDGEVGIALIGFSTADGTQVLIPAPEVISWADAADFLVLQSSGELTRAEDPTTADLVSGAAGIIEPSRALAVANDLPVFLAPVYATIEQSYRGTSFYPINLANAPWDGEDVWDQGGTYKFSQIDQARVMDAWLRVAASRTWVAGILPFGYWNHDLPLEPGFSIRGKSAELVLGKWMEP